MNIQQRYFHIRFASSSVPLLLFLAFSFFWGCEKRKATGVNPEEVNGLRDYSSKAGASPRALYNFSQSLAQLKSDSVGSSSPCLRKLDDNLASRDEFLACLERRGLHGLDQKFLESLVGLRLDRLKRVYDHSAAQSLELLNWIFDIALEQYSLSNPNSNWLIKDTWGKWRFSKEPLKSHDDFEFQVGDVNLSISASPLSTLIPQYTLPQRRLTHTMIYRGSDGHRKPHFIEAEFEEGVRFKYRDTYRSRDTVYETIVLRFRDPSLSEEELQQLRRNAVNYAAGKVGTKYGFTMNVQEGYFCNSLTGLSYADAFVNLKEKKREVGFADVELFLPNGFSPLRIGPSRIYATKFGLDPDETHFLSAGDFLSSPNFEPVAYYVQPAASRRFSDFYAIASATIDSFDRGSEIVVGPAQLQNLEPLMRDRKLLQGIIGMVRKLKRHSIIRDAIAKAQVSLELIDTLNVSQFKEILARLDSERKVLVEAAEDEISSSYALLNIGPNWGKNAFGVAPNLLAATKNSGDPSRANSGGGASNSNGGGRPSKTLTAKQFFEGLKAKGAANFTAEDFRQLELFINNLDFEGIKKVINYRSDKDFSSRLPVLGELVRIIDSTRGTLSESEFSELTSYLRIYALFLLSVPALQTKVNEFSGNEETLQNILKQAPFIASSLSDQTLIEFGTYSKIASGVVAKLEEMREKQGSQYLWQNPPWVQRTWVNFMLSNISLVRFVP